ncbi:MAG: hypothetical protein V4805_05635 [Pseudomonadota bacterium]
MRRISSRRSFLKLGLISGLALATAGGLYRAASLPNSPDKYVLAGEARAALFAIVPAILQGAITSTQPAIESAVDGVQAAIAALPLTTQNEIQDLFGLLACGPARYFIAGVPNSWSNADPADIVTFLNSWRTHRLAILQNAYQALHDLVLGSWYANQANWKAIGYPGPLAQLSN